MRVIAYARVSTAEQADGGISLEAQQAKMTAYAALYDLTVVETVTEAESGKSLNRSGLRPALELLKAGKADGLLIVKLDRLTRNVADWQTLIDDYPASAVARQLLKASTTVSTPARPPAGSS